MSPKVLLAKAIGGDSPTWSFFTDILGPMILALLLMGGVRVLGPSSTVWDIIAVAIFFLVWIGGMIAIKKWIGPWADRTVRGQANSQNCDCNA